MSDLDTHHPTAMWVFWVTSEMVEVKTMKKIEIIEVMKQKLLTNKIIRTEIKLSEEAEKARTYIKAHDFGCKSRIILGLVGLMMKEPMIDDDKDIFHFALAKCIADPSTGYTSGMRDGKSFILIKSSDEGTNFHVYTQGGDYTGQGGTLKDFEEVENIEGELEKFDMSRLYHKLSNNYSTEDCLRILL